MMTWFYWSGILLYSLVVLTIGWRGYRSQRGPVEDSQFWAAGRNLGAGATGLSISASFMSISWSCVYAVQLVYWYGLSSIWLLALPWLLVMSLFYILAPRFRKLAAFSQPEMVAARFGTETRKFIALPLAFVFLVWGGAEIFAAAHILTPLLKLPFHVILAFIALVVGTYSYMGGFAAVVNTDKIQFALVAFFVISVGYVAASAVLQPGLSLSGILSAVPAAPMTGKPALDFMAVAPGLVLITLFAYLPGWVVETDIWLRLQAARSDEQARRGVVIAAVNSLLFIAIFPLIIGGAALYLYQPVGGEIPAVLNDGSAIFSVFIDTHAPPALAVMLIVGLAAASMSTIDTCGNVVALSLSYDLLEPYLKGQNSRRIRSNIARWMSAGAVLLAYIYALFTDSLWDIFYLSSGVLTTTIFIPIVALFLGNVSAKQVKASALAGFFATIAFYFLEKRGMIAFLQPEWLAQTGLGYIVYAFLVSLLAFVFSGQRGTKSPLQVEGVEK